MACPTAQRTFMKDLQQLYRTIEASTDGQAFIVGIDAMTVKVSLRPKSGYNAHAEFMLTIKCHPAYPNFPPDVSFDSPIFHPNVDPSTGSVCVSLPNEWQRMQMQVLNGEQNTPLWAGKRTLFASYKPMSRVTSLRLQLLQSGRLGEGASLPH
ncbi:UBiquitin Conjugating enzyme family member [Echinococcus multilocularis]|uniref:UBiquitin Conjugating enzyme family member n=1 Tax=Echinococcus multilocularis TaxID=6211 RepID=A0A0S4ML97_ECHMU|nr:UBiquitin Conjugating enzyme family member [Echinococcus multilocularis]